MTANMNQYRKPQESSANWKLPLLLVLFVSVIFVALKIVVHRHQSRAMFMQLQQLEKQRDTLAAQWSRLKLEQGTQLNQVRVERLAQRELGMMMPKKSEIKIVRETINVNTRAMVRVPETPEVASEIAMSGLKAK